MLLYETFYLLSSRRFTTFKNNPVKIYLIKCVLTYLKANHFLSLIINFLYIQNILMRGHVSLLI